MNCAMEDISDSTMKKGMEKKSNFKNIIWENLIRRKWTVKVKIRNEFPPTINNCINFLF